MNYKKVFKRETKVIAYVVIALTLVVIGSSYALFMQVRNNTDNQIVKAGSLTVTYSNSNTTNVTTNDDGTNCLTPMTDDDGKQNGCDFKLSIYNTGTLPMAYDLLIYNNIDGVVANESTGSELVDLSNFKYQLSKQIYESEVKVTNGVVENPGTPKTENVNGSNDNTLNGLPDKNKEGESGSDGSGKKILESSVIQPGDTIVFDLKIWIKDDADEDIIGQQVSLKLDVVGVVYEGETLASTIEKLVSTTASSQDGKVEVFEHDTQTASIATTSENSKLKEYRYTGTNPNNFVYFGCDYVAKEEEPEEKENLTACTAEHLYRIIGVIPTQDMVGGEYVSRVKIIKNTYWSSLDNTSGGTKTSTFNYTGSWGESAVYKELNENYWKSLEKYQKYVAPSVLYFGNITNGNGGYTPDNLYSAERSDTTGILSTVGLMYPSDYGYSLGNDKKTTTIDTNTGSWLKVSESGQEEWLLTSPGDKALTLKTDGSFGTNNGPHAIRPSVYLQENVYVNGGTGSQTDPYILEYR